MITWRNTVKNSAQSSVNTVYALHSLCTSQIEFGIRELNANHGARVPRWGCSQSAGEQSWTVLRQDVSADRLNRPYSIMGLFPYSLNIDFVTWYKVRLMLPQRKELPMSKYLDLERSEPLMSAVSWPNHSPTVQGMALNVLVAWCWYFWLSHRLWSLFKHF